MGLPFVLLWLVSPALGQAGACALLYRLGSTHYVDCVLLAWARSQQGAADPAWREIATLPSRWTPPRFPLHAADLLVRGVAKGPALGEALRAAEAAWIAAGFPQGKAALDMIADGAARRARVL